MPLADELPRLTENPLPSGDEMTSRGERDAVRCYLANSQAVEKTTQQSVSRCLRILSHIMDDDPQTVNGSPQIMDDDPFGSSLA